MLCIDSHRKWYIIILSFPVIQNINVIQLFVAESFKLKFRAFKHVLVCHPLVFSSHNKQVSQLAWL